LLPSGYAAASATDPAEIILLKVSEQLKDVVLPDGFNLFGDPVKGVKSIGITANKTSNQDWWYAGRLDGQLSKMLASHNPTKRFVKRAGGMFEDTVYYEPAEVFDIFVKLIHYASQGNSCALHSLSLIFKVGMCSRVKIPGLEKQEKRAQYFRALHGVLRAYEDQLDWDGRLIPGKPLDVDRFNRINRLLQKRYQTAITQLEAEEAAAAATLGVSEHSDYSASSVDGAEPAITDESSEEEEGSADSDSATRRRKKQARSLEMIPLLKTSQ